MSWFKEVWMLAKMLFHRTSEQKKVELLVTKHFPFKGYKCMMWCGRVVAREQLELSSATKRHEMIHLRQARLYSHWWKYYLRYVWEWIKGNPLSHPSCSAYYTIPFEMEAYGNEHKLIYMPTKESLKRYTIKKRKAIYRENRKNWRSYCKKA